MASVASRGGPSGFDRLLAPESVAVIGSLSASEKPGARTVDHLRRAGYEGRVQAVGSVAELDGPVDVAVVAVPAAAVPGVLRELDGQAGHVVVYSSGFAEAGGESLARFHSGNGGPISILGPNTVGLYVAVSSAALAFAQALGPVVDHWAALPPGDAESAATAAALVTQSGAFGARISSSAAKRGVPLGTFIATGNEDGYALAEVLEGLAGSAVVAPRVVLVYIEAIRDGTRLQHSVRSLVRSGVEVLALVGGRSATGARAATSHTAALGSDMELVAEALFAAGAIVVPGDRELLDGLTGLALHRRAAGRRVGVLTGSGGAGVVATDLLVHHGLEVPELAVPTRQRLDELLPAYASTANPVDVTASAIGDPATLAACAEVLASSGEVDLLVTVGRAEQAGKVQAAAAPLPALMTVLDAGTEDLGNLAAEGVAATGDLTSAAFMAAVLATPRAPARVRDDAAVVDAGTNFSRDGRSGGDVDVLGDEPVAGAEMKALAGGVPGREGTVGPEAAGMSGSTGSASLVEPPTASESLGLVERYGIATAPWRRVGTVDEAIDAAEQLGWPVVLKADVPAGVHKARTGAVRLDVTRQTVEHDAEQLLHVVPSLIVASQLRGAIELFAGARRDEHFGVVVVAGLGGGQVELLGRTVSLPAATDPAWLAHRIDQVAFGGGAPPERVERLAAAAHSLARLVLKTGCAAAECNPLIEATTSIDTDGTVRSGDIHRRRDPYRLTRAGSPRWDLSAGHLIALDARVVLT